MGLRSLISEYKALSLAFLAATGYFLVVAATGSLNFAFDASTYIVIHSIIEAISVVIALMGFGITWHSFAQSKNRQDLFVGASLLAVGLIDTFHFLSYQDMPDLITPNTVNKAAQFWVAARLAGSASFLTAAFVRPSTDRPSLRPYNLLALALCISSLTFAWIIVFPHTVPTMFVPGKGLTPAKVYLEYLIVALNAASAYLFLRLYLRTREEHYIFFVGAMAVSIFSELFFTLYASPYDLYNFMGHAYKLLAFFLIYQMVFATSVKRPYLQLAHAKDDIMKYASGLEDMVRGRTAELAGKNSELERANRLKTEFMAICSHDMRSPIQGTMLMLDLLLEGADGPLTKEQRRSVEAVQKNEEVLLGLIANILDYARHEEGALRLEKAPVDMCALLDSWTRRNGVLAEKMGLSFQADYSVPEGAWVISADDFKVRQVLNNLASNALKFTPRGGTIRLTVREAREGGLELCLFNSGPAIPKEDLTAIFERFRKGHGTRRAAGEGAGLGLSICRTLVELHGGRIRAESAEGSGNTFCFTLPKNVTLNDSQS